MLVDVSASLTTREQASVTHDRLITAAVVLGTLVAFAAHFRPWEVAFLEEWPLAEFWIQQGPAAFAAHYAEWSLSRPLHLVPTALGLALAGGAPGGIFVILAATAAGQFVAVIWALRAGGRTTWMGVAAAAFISLHPLWPGGYLQRFLPAQVAALAMILATGMLLRWLTGGRGRWLMWAPVTLAVGLLVYPGPAVAAPMVAVVLAAVHPRRWRRGIAAVAATTAATGAVTLYSLVITRLIAPGAASYEAGNFAAGTSATPRTFVELLWGSLSGSGIGIGVGVLGIAVLGAILGVARAIPPRAAVIMIAAALLSPLCAAVFFGNIAWLADAERIAYATSLGLVGAVLVWPMTADVAQVALQRVLAVVLGVVALAGAVAGVAKWQPYIRTQHLLFSELGPVMTQATGNEVVTVVDHSGVYGSEYTLPQFYIDSAAHLMTGDDTRVWLCYLASDPPLAGAEVCDPADTGTDMTLARSFSTPSGVVDVYIGTPPAGG